MQTAAALLIKNLGKSILGEGSEELFTELANAAADTLIMGDLSDYNLAVRQYRAQGESEEEARRHAGWDVAKQAGLAFAGGGLMGFGSAAGGMAYNGAANRYAAPRAVESGSFYNALQYGLAQGEDTAAGRLARELAGRDTASSADVMRMLRAAESRQAEGGPGTQALVDPQLYTRAEVQGMSAGEVRENYDAIQESMRLWNKNGELLQSAETKTQTSKSNTEDIEVDVENTAVNDNPNTHTPEEMQRIEEYKQAVDPELVVYYDAVKNGEQNLPPYPVAQVSRRMADTIKTLTGMDVSDNTIVLDKNGVEHINRRHGKQGKADKSMANSEDVGRIKYVLEHFDGATLEPTFAKGYSRKNGKPAPKVVFYKKINGTYYVVEAASDANTKKNYIVSAYINKKIEGGQPLDVQAPKITSEPSTTNPSDKSIPHFPEKSTAPRLYTRAEVQGISAGEVRENYDAVRKSMEMWDENGELQGGTQSRMVDRQAPGEDNETTSGNERLYTRAEVQGMSEEEQLANVDAIRESMGLWDAEGKLAEQGSNSPDDGWDVQGKEAFKSNEEAYEYYLKVANELDVSTSFNTAVFYSGPGNRALAEAFARENNKTTLEITEGGKYLDALHLFSNESALTTEQAANVWKKLSERYAQGASGNAYGFVKGSRDGSIFNTVEYPALKSNPDITNIFTELFQKGENE